MPRNSKNRSKLEGFSNKKLVSLIVRMRTNRGSTVCYKLIKLHRGIYHVDKGRINQNTRQGKSNRLKNLQGYIGIDVIKNCQLL